MPIKFAVLALSLMSTACATTGGGPLGIVAFDRNQHVSAAEPLFGRGDERCLDDPTFLLTLLSAGTTAGSSDDICGQMRNAIRTTLPATGGYKETQRNEVIDAMMAASDRKCGRYIAFLQQYDANVNSTFGIAAQSAATLAAIATGGTAQALAAAASIAGGSRNTLNQSHFNNQTIGVLAQAFENKRAEIRTNIAANEALTAAQYTLMRGIQDATRYHSNCSIVVGLKQTQRAVEEAHSPSIATMEKLLSDLQRMQALQVQLAAQLPKIAPAPVPLAGAVATPVVTSIAKPVD